MIAYQHTYHALAEAIRQGPQRQIALVKAVDEAYALMHAEDLTDEQVLGLKVLIAHAETMIGRYFGM